MFFFNDQFYDLCDFYDFFFNDFFMIFFNDFF